MVSHYVCLFPTLLNFEIWYSHHATRENSTFALLKFQPADNTKMAAVRTSHMQRH
jgi:hypothetical protein